MEMWEPMWLDSANRILTIAGPEAIKASKDLAAKEGIFVGITAGVALVGYGVAQEASNRMCKSTTADGVSAALGHASEFATCATPLGQLGVLCGELVASGADVRAGWDRSTASRRGCRAAGAAVS